MKLIRVTAAALLLTATSAAHAEFSSTVTLTSDYDFRGVTQTSQDPALQASLDWAHDSGFYAGAWASNVDFGDCCDEEIELDLYAGFSGGEDITWDVGAVWYAYPGADDLDYPEIYAELGWNVLSAKLWYSWDFFHLDESAFYLEGNASFPFAENFSLDLHLGYSDGDGVEAAFGQDNYYDWAVGVTYTLSHFDLNLKWVDGSDARHFDGTPHDVLSSEARAIFSVSTTFPWSKE